MSLNQLKRTLHKEFMRNPAKSITLLALLPVAGYFIVPLLWKQMPSGKKGDQVSKPNFLATAGREPVAVAPGQPTGPGWQQTAEWIATDLRMRPARIGIARDPFHPLPAPERRIAATEQPAGEQTRSRVSLRPEDCGLQLTATIIGRTRQLATINGRLYSRDARVQFDSFNSNAPQATDSSETDNAFVLKSVAKSHVVLERNGELFRLTMSGGQEQ